MVSAPKKPAYSTIASPIKVLQSVALRHISGRLIVSEVENSAIAWQLHLGDGQLHYASSLHGQRELLGYILCRCNATLPSWIIDLPNKSIYSALCDAWREEEISLFQLRNLLRLISQEALVQVISKSSVELQFRRNVGLDPIIWSSPPDDLTTPLLLRAKGWRRLQPYISSPFQRICLQKPAEFESNFKNVLPSLQLSISPTQFFKALENRPCFYQLATNLDVKVSRLARVLRPVVVAGVVTLHPFDQSVITQRRPTIMCIDDSPTVQRKVRLILESSGYRVIGLTDPLTAISSLVREKPSLVFLDISMPNLDGYDLCRMLRRSPALQSIPIVMLTGRDGLIDRVRAKMVGASGYITKPFDAQSLSDVIQKFVTRG
ncbi:MAG: response regulator [Leptolyngbyaceae bacterium]|nr:response regulator [Leptolyngbyaceae bacterium]